MEKRIGYPIRVGIVEDDSNDVQAIKRDLKEAFEEWREGVLREIEEGEIAPWHGEIGLEISWLGPSDADFHVLERENYEEDDKYKREILKYSLMEGFHFLLIDLGLTPKEAEMIPRLYELGKEEIPQIGGFWVITQLGKLKRKGLYTPIAMVITQFESIPDNVKNEYLLNYHLSFWMTKNKLETQDMKNALRKILNTLAYTAISLPRPSLEGTLSWLWWKKTQGERITWQEDVENAVRAWIYQTATFGAPPEISEESLIKLFKRELKGLVSKPGKTAEEWMDKIKAWKEEV